MQNEHDITHLELDAVVNGQSWRVQSWAQVSKAYRTTIETLGLGASQTPPCLIVAPEGRVVAHLSYNGRVWGGAPERWQPDCLPIYDPSH